MDWHTLTTDYAHPEELPTNVREVLLDWLAVGLDPKRSVIFRQSDVKEHAEFFLLLSMIVPLGWLTRVPTYKEQMNEIKGKDLSTFGFLGYPVLQAADILLYKADGVPVGEDQLPHVELTREIVRRFNHFYGTDIPEPASLVSPTPKISGTDGRKMSKSYGNAIYLADQPEEIEKKVLGMLTDPARARLKDPGDPKNCNLFPLHKVVSDEKLQEELSKGCLSADLGCVDCKKKLIPNLVEFLKPIREKREKLANDETFLRQILEEGASKARNVAAGTMQELRRAMNLTAI